MSNLRIFWIIWCSMWALGWFVIGLFTFFLGWLMVPVSLLAILIPVGQEARPQQYVLPPGQGPYPGGYWPPQQQWQGQQPGPGGQYPPQYPQQQYPAQQYPQQYPPPQYPSQYNQPQYNQPGPNGWAGPQQGRPELPPAPGRGA